MSDDDEIVEPPTKRARTEDIMPSTNKRAKLEEDGIIMVEDDDVIVID